MQKTPIGWTDFSANLLKYRNAEGKTVWACVHVTEGCRNCYSEALAKRWSRGEAFTAENMKLLTPYFDVDEANQILNSKKITGKKVFIDDMTDLFGEWASDAIIDRHFVVFAQRLDVTFQVLTKRARRMRDYMENLSRRVLETAENYIPHMLYWPLPNVHLGVSCEDQKTADERIPLLLNTPATVRWASIEPLLNEVKLADPVIDWRDVDQYHTGEWDWLGHTFAAGMLVGDVLLCRVCHSGGEKDRFDSHLNGIVIGGESGHGHREMPLGAAVDLARRAKRAGVAVYFKQDSGPRPGMQGRVPDDVWAMKEWPEALNEMSPETTTEERHGALARLT